MATVERPSRLPAAVHLVRAGTVLVAIGGVAVVWWAATYQVPGGVCPAIMPPPFGCWPPRIGAGWAWTAVLGAAAGLAVVLPGRVASGRTAAAGVAALIVAALCCVAVTSLLLPPPFTVPRFALHRTGPESSVLVLDRFDRQPSASGARRVGYLSADSLLEKDPDEVVSYVDLVERLGTSPRTRARSELSCSAESPSCWRSTTSTVT